jgi:hypothetical protein
MESMEKRPGSGSYGRTPLAVNPEYGAPLRGPALTYLFQKSSLKYFLLPRSQLQHFSQLQ